MKVIGGEAYPFVVYVTYPGANTEPVLVVYPDISDRRAGGNFVSDFQKHADNGDEEGEMVVHRTVAENKNHLYESTFTSAVTGGGAVALEAALKHLRAVHGNEVDGFFAHCWKLAQSHQQHTFPQKFPTI
jgi:hypothetical protein